MPTPSLFLRSWWPSPLVTAKLSQPLGTQAGEDCGGALVLFPSPEPLASNEPGFSGQDTVLVILAHLPPDPTAFSSRKGAQLFCPEPQRALCFPWPTLMTCSWTLSSSDPSGEPQVTVF